LESFLIKSDESSKIIMQIKYAEIGACGLSCRLCPQFYTKGESRCGGCKTKNRMAVGCPFITCAVKKSGIEFCWKCTVSPSCEKWKNHKKFSKQHDTFVCYQKLEDNIKFIQSNGVEEFVSLHHTRGKMLQEMLEGFNEGRSKSYYCIAATVMEIDELKEAIKKAKEDSVALDMKGKSKLLHSILDAISEQRGYNLKLRKYTKGE
jgi:hypothetical protein